MRMNVTVVPVKRAVNTSKRIIVALPAPGSGVILIWVARKSPPVFLALFVILLIGFVYVIHGYTAKA